MVSTFTNLDYQVGKYFKVREFQSKDGYPTVLIDDNLVDLLDQIREYFGKPVVITSGYRTKSHLFFVTYRKKSFQSVNSGTLIRGTATARTVELNISPCG